MVREIIDQYIMYDVEYRPGYTNHLPMVLVSLEKIDSDRKTLENFANHYIERLKLLEESAITVDKGNWENFLRAHSYFEERIMALNYQWLGLCCAYVSIGRPLIHFKGEKIADRWEDIFNKAKTTLDPHVANLVYSCSQEYEIYSDPIYCIIPASKAADG